MDDILHSAVDNAPAGMFGYPHFNEVDRPELLAHDLADEGWDGQRHQSHLLPICRR